MADPVALADFWDLIVPFIEMRKPFKLEDNSNTSGIGTGQILVVETAPRFWVGSVAFRALYSADARYLQTLIEDFSSGKNSFYAYDPLYQYPPFDPKGNKLAANPNAPIEIYEVGTNLQRIKVNGLPKNFQVTAGMMFSLVFGPSNVYSGLHRFKNSRTADDGGLTDWLNFNPPLDDPDISAGKNLQFIKPFGKFKMVPKSFNEGSTMGVWTTEMGFDIEQVP